MIVKNKLILKNRKSLRFLFIFLFVITNLNSFILTEVRQKDQSKVTFKQDASYQSGSKGNKKSKVPPGAKISPTEDCVMFKNDRRLLVGIDNEGKELWRKVFPSDIIEFGFERKIGDRIEVKTKNGMWIAENVKGNFSLEEKVKAKSLTRSPNGSIYVDVKGKSNLILGDSATGIVSKSIQKAHNKRIKFYDFISKNLVLTVGEDNIIKIWNTNTYEMVRNIEISPSQIQAGVLTFDKKYLVLGTYDSDFHIGFSLNARPTDVKEKFKLKIIDTNDLSIIKEIKGLQSKIVDISISADNKFAAVVTENKTVDIWDLENSYKIRSFSGEHYIDAEFGPMGISFILVTELGKIQRYITQGIVVDSRPQFVGEKYKVNTPTTPIINRLQSGMTIALLDFSGLLINSEVAETISYSFRNRISNYSYIQLVERDEMNKILNEQGIQNSGVSNLEKAAEIGKILNAQKLIMGKLSKLGSTLITTIKVVDVETAKIDGGREVECQNYALENVPEIIDILLSILIEK